MNGNERKPSVGSRIGWGLFGAGMTLLVTVIGIYIANSLSNKAPAFYYIKHTPSCYSFADEQYTFGTIEIGNSGDMHIDNWQAIAAFPEGVTLRGISIQPQGSIVPEIINEPTPKIYLKASLPLHYLNANDKILLNYFINKDISADDIDFSGKGSGSTALERKEGDPTKTSSTDITSFLLILVLFILSLFGAIVAFLALRMVKYTDERLNRFAMDIYNHISMLDRRQHK